MNLLALLLITLAVVAIAVLLLGVRVFFVRKGKFPNTHIEGNKALEKQGIRCAAHSLKEEEERESLLELMKKDEL